MIAVTFHDVTRAGRSITYRIDTADRLDAIEQAGKMTLDWEVLSEVTYIRSRDVFRVRFLRSDGATYTDDITTLAEQEGLR